jgi:hypothetical protein
VVGVLDGAVPADRQQRVRGWSDDDWDAAGARARARPPGFRAAIDHTTDELATGPVRALGVDGLDALCRRLAPIVAAVAASGVIPHPNPVGVPLPR